jgi:hypothetical protein
VMGDWVAFEADYHDPALTYGWSVIIKAGHISCRPTPTS